ncbi:transketolase C-terminal domain-containing protein [Dyella sp.]|jgi:transketolase|uniref:transketolase family protein n=1 Tax=Dyella sp. TaxID=1869338 RepID=UPI002FD8ABD4
MKLAEHLADLLCARANEDKALFVLDGDLADSDGADRFAVLYPERFLMAGIAEQNLLGVAAGLASTGMKPWAFSFAAFLVYRAYDQIRVGIAQSRQPVVLVGSHAGALAARNGKSHATLNDIALMSTLPHMHVYAPADHADLAWLVPELSMHPRAAYLRLPRADIDALPMLGGEPGPIRVLAPPASRTIISTGLATHWASTLVKALVAQGETIGLIHLPQLKPLPDLEPLLEDVDTLISIEDHVVLGGLGSLLQDRFPRRAVTKLGWPVSFAGASGSDEDLRRAHMLDAVGLLHAVSCVEPERRQAC